MKRKIAIAIRGHERGAMSDSEMSDTVFELSKIYDVDIFIHTWDLSEAVASWRHLPKERNKISEERIRNYFFRNEIKKLIIENDEEIEIYGRISGRLGFLNEVSVPYNYLAELISKDLGAWVKRMEIKLVSENNKNVFCFLQYGCPVLPWKKMWYGIYTITNFIKGYKDYDLILNTRFDILNYKKLYNPGSPLINLEVIKRLIDRSHPGNLFTFTKERKASCIDNIYTAEPAPLLELCRRFHFHLDELVLSYDPNDWDGIQEHLVYLEAQKIKESWKK